MTDFGPGLHAAPGRTVDVAAYDRYLGRWSRLFVPDVLAAATITEGCTVLDICTGTGEAAAALLPLVGAAGAVVGADISLDMVQSARARVQHPAFLPVVADGQALPFRDGCFDALVCQLGLQFFPDPARGLAEFQRVLRRGGKAAVCVVSRPERAPMWGFLAETLCRYLPAKRPLLMASFSLADARQVAALFTGAGFTNVSVARAVRHGTIDSTAEYWDAIEAGIGSLPQAYLMLTEADRHAVREEVTTRLTPFMVGGTLHLSVEMVIGCGQAAQESAGPGPSGATATDLLDSRLASRLVCPGTREPLDHAQDAGALIGQRTGVAFPIRDGIPILLPIAGHTA
jgi:ubiquinone/menaquinone biosynthesis C-methylase UbiE/uncharacterized protein YbaR (Trm112 family)